MKPSLKILFIATFFIFSLFSGAHIAFAEGVYAKNIWARPSYALKNGNGVVYLTLENINMVTDALIDVKSPVANRVMVHEMFEKDGHLAMRHVSEVLLPPNQAVALKPGGLHIMLLGLHKPLKIGDTFPLDLIFKNTARQEVLVKVQNNKQ